MSGSEKKVHFISASDRINYGDLLFPIIFKKFVEDENYLIEFYNYGLVKSDLSHYGALPTHSYIKLLKNVEKKGGKLIIGGGEVFFANWKTLYSFINPMYVKLSRNRYFKKIDNKFDFSKLVLSTNKVSVPFCPSKKELKSKDLEIYYSSVGGTFCGNKNSDFNLKLSKVLNESSLLSVRDNRTLKSMQEMSLEAKLVPDTAIIMSDFFTKDLFHNKIGFEEFKVKNYIFLQLGRYKGPDDLKQFATDVKKLSKILNLDVVLCPIGKAPRHEDDIILKEVQKFERSFCFINPKNIFEVMYLIANSSLFMGTSLHGLITAQSFNIPFIGLNPEVGKLESYMKTWIDENMCCLSFQEIKKIDYIYNNWDFQTLIKKTNIQKKQVKENLRMILNGL